MVKKTKTKTKLRNNIVALIDVIKRTDQTITLTTLPDDHIFGLTICIVESSFPVFESREEPPVVPIFLIKSSSLVIVNKKFFNFKEYNSVGRWAHERKTPK